MELGGLQRELGGSQNEPVKPKREHYSVEHRLRGLKAQQRLSDCNCILFYGTLSLLGLLPRRDKTRPIRPTMRPHVDRMFT